MIRIAVAFSGEEGRQILCRMLETQRSAEWRGISVTKPLAACYRSKDR